MKIKVTYDKREDLPAGYEELYEERDGKFVLTGVEGMKQQGDVDRLQASLVSERAAHKDTKNKLAKFGDLNPDEVHERLDLVEELEAKVAAAGKDKPDEQAIERIVETRVKRVLAPVERERDALKAQVQTLTGEKEALDGTLKRGRIEDGLRKAATELKVQAPALEDVLLHSGSFELDDQNRVVTRDGVDGLTPGLAPDVWLKDMQEKRPHWWALSSGGGANGSGKAMPGGGPNPWSAAGWNLTEQGKYLRANGAEKAKQLAAQAGTTVGGPKPAAK